MEKDAAQVEPMSVRHAALKASLWSYAGTLLRIAAQLVAAIVFARVLGPDAMGGFALVMLVIGPCRLLAELGMGPAIVQTKALSTDDLSRALLQLVGAGVAMAAALEWLAEPIATLMGHAALAQSLRLVAPVFVLYAPAAIANGLLIRRLDQRTAQLADLAAYVLGFVGVGSVMAAAGWRENSLVVGFVAQIALLAMFTWWRARPGVWPARTGAAGQLAHFGRRVVATNLSNWIIENVDNLVVGRLMGVRSLGLYSVSYNLVRTPTGHLVNSLQSVLFPAAARTQQQVDRVRDGYLAVLSLVALVLGPVFAGVAVASSTVVEALYGKQWLDAAPLLVPLALAMPAHGLTSVTGPILWGRGSVTVELSVQWKVAGVLVVLLPLLSLVSITAVAWGVFVLYLCRAVWLIGGLREDLRFSWRDILESTTGALWLSGIVAMTISSGEHVLAQYSQAPWLHLMSDIGIGAGTTLGALLATRGLLCSVALKRGLASILPSLPRGVGALVALAAGLARA